MKVAVIGGGSIGLSAALAAAQMGMSVSVYDPQGFELEEPSGEMSPRVWALGPKATALLHSLGVWREDPRLCPYQKMRVIDATSDGQVRFEDPELGVIVEADWVKRRLLDGLHRLPIERITSPVIRATPEGAVVVSEDQVAQFDLVVLAEGRAGQTARASGFTQIDGGYRQTALVATLAAKAPHGNEAFQVFTPEGPLALLPLPDHGQAHRVSLVWSVSVDTAQRLQAETIDALTQRLIHASEGVRGQLEFVSEPIWIPLSQHTLRHGALGRCIAIGDTAHGILPLAGLGANLGFADVAALIEAMQRSAPNGAKIARTVERLRRFDQHAVAWSMGLFSDVFRSTDPMVRLGRSLALRTADRHGSLRRLVQELAG